MKFFIAIVIFNYYFFRCFRRIQHLLKLSDSSSVIVHKDPRLDLLVKKQIQINEKTSRESQQTAKGFRILVINTNKRNEAIDAKDKSVHLFP